MPPIWLGHAADLARIHRTIATVPGGGHQCPGSRRALGTRGPDVAGPAPDPSRLDTAGMRP